MTTQKGYLPLVSGVLLHCLPVTLSLFRKDATGRDSDVCLLDRWVDSLGDGERLGLP